MIKKILIAALVAIPMLASAQTLKFGTVDAQQIFLAMPERAQAETTMAEVSKKYEDEHKILMDEAQKKYTEFQNLDPNTPQSIKERRMQDITEIDRKLEDFRKMAAEDIQKKQAQLLEPIQQKLNQAVQSVGAENGFTFIFDVTTVMYKGATAQDVTPLVKEKLGIK